ncbi:MAG TPA: TonB-dependent receptor [Steroidobacteraceae bacterium]|nr:TonB-dependent receptor [Steroidobacteraceae bacterium]
MTVASGAVAVHAQEQAPAAEQTLQTVVVTGSIIKRTDFETPSPVQVMTAEDLQQSGYTSISDVLRNLSANGQGTLSQSFNFAFAGGGAGIALRGLTVGGTLTLVDSQRMIPYPLSDDSQRNFVDVSSIPFNVIDRVDVLKDGASAEYGSDAIAGVVNIVLKKSFTGASITAEAGTTSKSDGTTEHLAGIWGTGDLGSDGYNAYLAVEFRHQDRILVSNRHGFWTNLDWTPYGGFDTRNGANDIAGGNVRPAIPGGYVLDPATNAFDGGTRFLNTTACKDYATFVANGCVWQGDDQIQPQTANLNALGRFTKNLAGDWQAVGTASLFRSEAEQVQGGRQTLVSGSPRTSFGYGPGVNPFPVNVPRTVLPFGAVNNPFPCTLGGVPSTPAAGCDPARLISDFLGRSPTTQFVANTYRFFGELRGSAAGWDIDGTLGWMYSSLNQKTAGATDRVALAATAATGTFNFVTATYPQMAAAFAPETEVKDTNTMQVADLHGTHELAQLPGGALSLALGGGMNHLYKNSLAAYGGSSGLQAQVNGAYVLGGQTNSNAYLEFVAPLFKGFELDAAGRYDKYNQYGSSTTPKLGIKYTPFRMLTARGTWGKGFRAPNPAEAGNSAAAFGGVPGNDFNLCPNPANPNAAGNFPSQCNLGITGLGLGNKNLQPEKSTNWTAGLIFSPFDATSISVDYWDIKINQDIQSGSSIAILGANDPTIAALFPITYGAQILLPFCTANNVCNTDKLTPLPGPLLYQAFPYLNLTQTHVNGIDLDLSSKFDIGAAGKLTATLNATYMFHYIFGLPNKPGLVQSYDLAGTHGPSIISGDTGNPKIRAVATLGWDLGPWNVTATVNYVGRFNVTDPTNFEPDCRTAFGAGGVFGGRFDTAGALVTQNLLDKYCEVHSFTDVDLYAQYAFTKSFSVHASVLNLLATDPPVDMTTYGAAANIPYNPAMHQAGAVGRFFNVGGTYTF